MVSSLIFLKVKQLSLQAEKQIIRRQADALIRGSKKDRDREFLKGVENKTIYAARLLDHDRWVVSPESRATHLARAFLAGKPFRTTEQRSKFDETELDPKYHPSFDRILAMAVKYDRNRRNKEALRADLEGWLSQPPVEVAKPAPKPRIQWEFKGVYDENGKPVWGPI